jgi:hypothetical protein
MLVALFVVIGIVGVGGAAVYYGLRDRSRVERQASAEHYSKGLAYLEQNQYELAVAEFELVLQLDPENADAQAKLVEAKGRLQVQPTATPALQKETAAAYFAQLQEAYDAKDWPRVLAEADRVLAVDPAYERGRVDQMLFEAFYASGQQLVAEDRTKEAVRLFDRALQLQPDNTQVQHARTLASLYMDSLSYWGADWPRCVALLASLYELAPDYKDVGQRFVEANTAWGDAAWQQQDWCTASEAYASALHIVASFDLAERQRQAAANCLVPPTELPGEGTPTPGQPEGSIAPTGTYVGRLVERTGIDSGKMYIRGKVLNRAGKGVQSVQVKIHAWDWSALAVTDGNGQYSFDGLSNPVTYTLSLVDVSSYPFEIKGEWGKIGWVEFNEAK